MKAVAGVLAVFVEFDDHSDLQWMETRVESAVSDALEENEERLDGKYEITVHTLDEIPES